MPEDILSRDDDIMGMVKSARTIRDKALICSLWESGCRRTEFFTRKIKHLVFDKYGAVLIVEGKTGMRRIRLIESTQYLAQWLNTHPERENSESSLWVCLDNAKKGNRLGMQSIVDILKSAAAKAGIQKRVNPHSFRSSRATFLAGRITEQQLKVLMGWTKDSEMCAKYVHLSGREVDNALLKMNGIKTEDESKDVNTQIYPVCQFVNSPDSQFCSRCGKPLTIELATKMDEDNKQINSVMDKIFADTEKADVIKGWIKEVLN